MDTGGPQVCDDMTVEVALSVMAGARTGHLLVCDNDGLCTGLLTQAQLTAPVTAPRTPTGSSCATSSATQDRSPVP